jgi:hypothetical protein
MKKFCISMACSLLFAGCGHEADKVVTTATVRAKPARAVPGGGESVAAVVLGTSHVPVALRFTLADKPVIGQKLRVKLVFTATEPAELQVSAQGRDLVLESGAASALSFKQPGEEVTNELVLTPQVAGLAALEVHVRPSDPEQHIEAVFSVPLLAQKPGA